ncbi:hypothetical protein HRG_001413 [Hirsutella rhossiliensis]|uniref:Uncharacterized protein n=1 Tax=Hirsutella rhossiliensis TaxID=111463 RepID=A0A9P8NA33_9HYPO|nr:uncharacterized protein HRG_01413 [Hirsutella rhossiliensis]KAH0968771.1 hypothetical protein HRG_01413 [Hirsutella rhossiliensis]
MAWNNAQGMGSYALEDLYNLPEYNRKAILRQLLVQADPVIIHPLFEPDDFNPDVSSGLLLLQELTRRTDKLGTILGVEAKEIYYGENEFLVWWDGLHAFMHPPGSGVNNSSEIGRMVRKIVVRYDMRDMDDKGSHLATELKRMFELTRAEHVAIELLGSGTVEGSDFATQAVIQGIAAIVGALIRYFGDAFTIRKALGGWVLLGTESFSCFRSYWDSPSESARERASRSEASFEELMQIQVNRWIGEHSMTEPRSQFLDHGRGQTFLTADLGRWPAWSQNISPVLPFKQ